MKKRPKTLQETDSFIMDHILMLNMCQRILDIVNKARLYLQVGTIAEIANPEGTRIDPAWLGDGKKQSWSKLKWPSIISPSKKMWST